MTVINIWNASLRFPLGSLLLLLNRFSPTLCDPKDCSLRGSPVLGILQARTLEWVCHFLLQCMKMKRESEDAQSCPTLNDPMDCSLPGSSIHGIFQARVLEWGAIAVSLSSQWVLLKVEVCFLFCKQRHVKCKKNAFCFCKQKNVKLSLHRFTFTGILAFSKVFSQTVFFFFFQLADSLIQWIFSKVCDGPSTGDTVLNKIENVLPSSSLHFRFGNRWQGNKQMSF